MNDLTDNLRGSLAAMTSSAGSAVSAFTAATFIRDLVRDRQKVILRECDRIHKSAPIQGAAWLLVLTELDTVADVCNSICHTAYKASGEAMDAVPNVPTEPTASTNL